MNKIIFTVFFALFLISCANEDLPYKSLRQGNDSVVNIDKIKGTESFLVDSLFHEPRYIKLESTDKSLIGQIDKLLIANDTIYIMESSKVQQAIFVFSMEGKFLYSIDKRGQGPGEYIDVDDFYVDTDNQEIGILSSAQVYRYTFGGEFVTKLNFRKYFVNRIAYNKGSIYGYCNSYGFSKKAYALRVFDLEGNMVYEDYPQQAKLTTSHIMSSNKKIFATNEGNTYFSPFYNDTIFEVGNGYMKPFLTMNFGEYKFPQERMDELIKEQGSLSPRFVDAINSKYVVFGVSQFFVSDKYFMANFLKEKSRHHFFYSFRTGKIKIYNSFENKTDYFVYHPGDYVAVYKDDIYSVLSSDIFPTFKQIYRDRYIEIGEEKIEYAPARADSLFYETYIKDSTEDENPMLMVFKLKDF